MSPQGKAIIMTRRQLHQAEHQAANAYQRSKVARLYGKMKESDRQWGIYLTSRRVADRFRADLQNLTTSDD